MFRQGLPAGGGEANSHGHPRSHWRRLLREGLAEGARNDTIASRAGHLLRHGLDPEVAAELLLAWNVARCRPPLAEEERLRILGSFVRIHQHEEGGAG